MAGRKWHNPVRSQMSGTGASSKTPPLTNANGVFDHNPDPPFGKPHDTGNGGIPLKFKETLGETTAQRIFPGRHSQSLGTAAGLGPGAQGPRPISRPKPPSNKK